MNRLDIFARDGWRCVYCGNVFDAAELTVDHVQPRVRQGDQSGGNLVTACQACNARKANLRLGEFLIHDATARDNFFRYAVAVWPRHLRALEQELRAAGVVRDRDDN
jgi:5-methylcytosine-specific restriction endonuclease McrA